MRFVVLSRNAGLYSTSRLVRAARARGHEAEVVDPTDLQVGLGPGVPLVGHRGAPLEPRYDVALARIGTAVVEQGSLLCRALERTGTVVLNRGDAITRCHDKASLLFELAAADVPVPPTIVVRGPDGLAEAAAQSGFPVVVKLLGGTQGLGTMLAESRRSLIPLAETMLAMGQTLLLQAYLPRRRDVRVFVVGDRVVAAMERRAKRGEFRANLHRGAKAVPVTLPRAVNRLAVRAAAALALDVAGIDLLLDDDNRAVVLEANASPGLEGIEVSTAVDVADHVIRLGEQRAQAR